MKQTTPHVAVDAMRSQPISGWAGDAICVPTLSTSPVHASIPGEIHA